jgi:predicted dehydrogenase
MISHGMDLGPYTRLARELRLRMEGRTPSPGPSPGTFVDGVKDMLVLDAIRRSAAERSWVAVEELI